MRSSRARRLFEVGSVLIRPFPLALVEQIGSLGGRLAAQFLPGPRGVLADNLARVVPEASSDELDALARDGFASYGRYWSETLRLPSLSPDVIDRGFDVHGFEHIQQARAAGVGPIMVLPHLGGWEWAAAWLGLVADIPVSAVVEQLEPEDVFEWFRELRESYGIDVVPLGGDAVGRLVRAVRDRHVVCLLADRDLTGTGVEVEFFGESAFMPVGPALLARRTGAPLLPTSVAFVGRRRLCRIRPPIPVERTKNLRADLAVTTQRLAFELEGLIRDAPEQWHVLEPLWGPATGSAGRQ